MGIKEKLPLINSTSKRTRMVGYVVYAWIGLAILMTMFPTPDTTTVDSKTVDETKPGTVSVDVGGYTFTADLGDQWQTSSNSPESDTVEGYNSGKSWEGVYLENAFWLPKTGVYPPNVANLADDPRQEKLIAVVDVGVHTVPKELQGESPHDILSDMNVLEDDNIHSVKDIEFNGRPALLVQTKHEGETGYGFTGYGFLSILMTNNIVVNVDVTEWPNVSTDIVSWDVMKKFTVSPK